MIRTKQSQKLLVTYLNVGIFFVYLFNVLIKSEVILRQERNYVCRRNREILEVKYERRVQEIFEEEKNAVGRRNLAMPKSFQQCFIRFFLYGIPNAENKIREVIRKFILPYRQISPAMGFDLIIKESYQKIKSRFPTLDFPTEREFKDRFYVTYEEDAFSGTNPFTKDIVISLNDASFAKIIPHESIHSLIEGVLIRSLQEGITSYLEEKIFGIESRPEYRENLELAKQLIQTLGEEIVIDEIFAFGSFKPLTNFLGKDGIELLELKEVLELLEKDPDWKNYGIEDEFTLHIINKKDDREEKARIKEIILKILLEL